MPDQEHPQVPRREWTDPATVVALVAFLVGLVMVFFDKLDTIIFAADVDFGPYPYVLLGIPLFWFIGIKLPSLSAGDNGGKQ